MDHLKPVTYARLREKKIMDHVLKCFTFGKQVRRIEPPEDEKGNKIEEMQRKFNRVRLIRTFHSIKRRNLQRKFDDPLDQHGIAFGKIDMKFDDQQYCVESDIEHEYPRRTEQQSKNV